ncbi:MAG: 30S ribosomal protein S4 [bacterium]|nr:30S ribosomal protein S4 [bacterium]
MVTKRRKFKEIDFQKWSTIKSSDYGRQLREKQKARYTYGVMEKQFRRYYNIAARAKGSTGEILLQLLERRLDNIVYRLGLAVSRHHARQLINHRKININGKILNISSYIVEKNDVIQPKKIEDYQIYEAETPKWLSLDKKTKTGKVINLPSREEMPLDINEQLIVEYYSR